MDIPLIGEVDTQRVVDWLRAILSQLEGEYKWYVVGIVMLIVTAAITQFIFKTMKWFLLLALLAVILFGAFWGMSYLTT